MCDAPPARKVDGDLWQALAGAMWPIGYIPHDCLRVATSVATPARRADIRRRTRHYGIDSIIDAVRAAVAR